MTRGYLFISNGRIVPREKELSLEPINTGSFEGSSMYAANELGMKLYMGVNRDYADQIKGIDYDITFYNQHIYRNIFGLKDIWIGYKNLCEFINSHPDIEIIHCNTPIGGVLGRICGHKFNKKVIYTAHGFHFFKGSPLVNRTIFKWIEQWMAHYTDLLITINHEDFDAAQKFRLHKGGKVVYVPGVGMDTTVIGNIKIDVTAKKAELGLSSNSKIGIVVGDLNNNKNVKTIIKAVALLKEPIHLLVCGLGPNEQNLKELTDSLNLNKYIHFLGYRTDVRELYKISDMFIMASKREGLPRSTMEAMAAGLPCVVSKIRGNVDLIDEGMGGFLVSPNDEITFSRKISMITRDIEAALKMKEYNLIKVKQFDIEVVNKRMVEVFNILANFGIKSSE